MYSGVLSLNVMCRHKKSRLSVMIKSTCFFSSPFFSFQESISTCRFAQRVALIKNDALLNEEIDPKLVSSCSQNCVCLKRDWYVANNIKTEMLKK